MTTAQAPEPAQLEMPRYRCHKEVRALEIREVVGRTLRLVGGTSKVKSSEWMAKHNPQPGGFLVQYKDGYMSYSPREAFEDGYTLMDIGGMNFSDALTLLKKGLKVAREGWNGKGMFVFLVPGSRFTVNRPPLLGIYPEGTVIDYRAHIDMKTAQGDVVPWVASQTDLLADDWEVVES